MKETIEINCKNNNTTILAEKGSTLLEIYHTSGIKLSNRILCAIVNNRTEELRYRVYKPKDIEFLDITSPYGMRTYIRTLCLVLYKAVHDIIPEARLRIEHSISKGYFCLLSQNFGETTVTRIKDRMREIIDADMPITRIETRTDRAILEFRKRKMKDKVKLLSSSHSLYTVHYTLDDVIDAYQYELTPSTGYLSIFDFVKYSYGYLLIPPNIEDPTKLCTVQRQDKLLGAFEEQTRFNDIAGLQNVGEMNIAIAKIGFSFFIFF
ncbi:MAG: hypothetical protein RR341_06435 [Bacteroidales bacterium]